MSKLNSPKYRRFMGVEYARVFGVTIVKFCGVFVYSRAGQFWMVAGGLVAKGPNGYLICGKRIA